MDKNEALRNLMMYSVDQKPTDFADTFNDYLMDKVHTSINNKKIEYAKNMFGSVTVPSTPPEEKND